MVAKNHDLELDRHLIKQIDYVLPKLKYSINIRKIIRWLENFNKTDVNMAIDLLYFLEYIDFPELTYRMNDVLQEALNSISITYNVVIYPGVATYPKSTEVINYILKDTPAFKSRKNIIITRDIEKDVTLNEDTAFIFVDDFIGSGKSFAKGYTTKTKLKDWMDANASIKQRCLISAICMNNGKSYINSLYPEIKLFSNFRDKLFHPTTSVFSISNNISLVKAFSLRYGNLSNANNIPYGYDESESLVAFSHTTPNNTLPIIWGDKEWYPIFPRNAKSKVEQANEIKTEIDYYLGIMNRLGIVLNGDKTVKISGKRKINYNQFTDHSLLTVIKLQIDGYAFPVICQILGITINEYELILKYGKQQKLIGIDGKVNNLGFEFFKKLMSNVKGKRFYQKDKDLFKMKSVNYVPKSFMGKA